MAEAAPSLASELSSLFVRIRLGSAFVMGDLTLFPLLRDDEGPDAELLEEGLDRKHTTITEVSDRGDVNRVQVSHTGVLPLLLLDGEQVVGAKQNRIFNASFLIPPGETLVVAVSCVERGRWDEGGEGFRASRATVTSAVRARKLARVSHSVAAGSGYDAQQGAVWQDVDGYLSRTHVHSVTASFADAYAVRAKDVEQDLSRIRVERQQVGIAAFRGNRLVGLDLFASTKLYGRAWKKVLRGVLGEVYERSFQAGDPMSALQQVLQRLAQLPVARRTAPGWGETLHGVEGGLALGAVVHERHVYHACAAAV